MCTYAFLRCHLEVLRDPGVIGFELNSVVDVKCPIPPPPPPPRAPTYCPFLLLLLSLKVR